MSDWKSRMKKNTVRLHLIRLIALITAAAVLFGTVGLVSAKNGAGTNGETVTAGYSEELLAAVYAYGSYKVSLRDAVYLDNGRDDGKMLTDRIYTNAKPKSEREKTEGWVMIGSKDGKTDYRATVTVDIGFCAKDVVRFYLRAFRSTALGAEMPARIRFYVSEDGEEFTYIGEPTTMTDISVDNSAAVYSLITEKGISCRYYRAVIDCTAQGALWLNEVGAAAKGKITHINSGNKERLTDADGLVYRIVGNSAEVISAENQAANETAVKPSTQSFNKDGITYTLGKGSGNEVKVIADFIEEGRPNYSGVPNNIQYIVIHNTGTTEEDTDAERYNHRMHVTEEETGWHYTVDDNKIYHSLADSIVGWHAGSSHNYCSIGIEICTNGAPKRSSGAFVFSGSAYENWVENRFKKSLRNTAVLVAELLTRYGLSTDAVIQHYDVTEKNCPLWLREKNGKYVYEGTLWTEFMGYVEEYYKMLNGASPSPTATVKAASVIPDYVVTDDGEVYPVTKISGDAFVDMTDEITVLTLGKMIDTIEQGFLDGTLLEAIKLGSNDRFYLQNGSLYSREGVKLYDPSEIKSVVPAPKDSARLDIREYGGRYYLFVDTSQTLYAVSREYGANEFSAKNINGEALEPNDKLATGAVLNLDGARLYAVLPGDADGNAIIDQYDYILARRTYMETFFPQKRQLLAMTLSGEETVCVFDYILLKRHVLGTYDIFK